MEALPLARQNFAVDMHGQALPVALRHAAGGEKLSPSVDDLDDPPNFGGCLRRREAEDLACAIALTGVESSCTGATTNS